MNVLDIKNAERGISFFDRFLSRFSEFDEHRLEARLDAVEAIGKAAMETRAWTEELRREGEGVADRGQEISDLWLTASRKIARFDTALAGECIVKAYGWRTGKWDNPEYAIIPRRVEEVHAHALKLIKEYQPFLGKVLR